MIRKSKFAKAMKIIPVLRKKPAFTLVEVTLSIVLLSLSFSGVYKLFIEASKRTLDPLLGYQLNSFAQTLSREIGRLDNVSASNQCASGTDGFNDVCLWEDLDDFICDKSFFDQQFPSISSSYRQELADKNFTLKSIPLSASTAQVTLTSESCPNSQPSCQYTHFRLEIKFPNNETKAQFEVLREVDA